MSYNSEYYEKNKAKILARNKAWREANLEKYNQSQRSWRQANEGHTYQDSDSGYVHYIGYEHPATNPSGLTKFHRIVLWNKLQGEDSPCHWCGRQLFWSKKAPFEPDALCVDHVNIIKNDNRPENLVPSCIVCNLTREGGQRERVKTKNLNGCKMTLCDRTAVALDMCAAHYMQSLKGRELTELRTYHERITADDSELIVERITSGETIKQVGEDTGYDYSAVARIFKRATGLSVREFKKSRRAA